MFDFRMKTIPLTKGKFAIVDDEDFEYLNQWKWHLDDKGYAARNQHVRLAKWTYTSRRVVMHRLVNKTPEGFSTDHINRNKLDNRRCNLRTVTQSVNAINSGISKTNKSGTKGVYLDGWTGKWRAEIKIHGKKITLGRFSKKEDAIFARKEAELKYHAI